MKSTLQTAHDKLRYNSDMTKQPKPTYRELQSELDEVLAKLQSGDVDIDESTRLYKRGMDLVVQLQMHLDEAENTIIKIKQSFQ